MSSEATVSFDDYEWEQDEEWQVLIKKLEFPGSFDEAKKEKHILKRKQKYFKEKIDPNFVPTLFVYFSSLTLCHPLICSFTKKHTIKSQQYENKVLKLYNLNQRQQNKNPILMIQTTKTKTKKRISHHNLNPRHLIRDRRETKTIYISI